MLKEPSLELLPAGHGFFPAREPGEGGVTGDKRKRLVVTEIRAITTFPLVFCFPSLLRAISNAHIRENTIVLRISLDSV